MTQEEFDGNRMKRTVRMDIVQGDCLEVLKTYKEDTFTAVVTDPPAGISLMGKEWDKDKGGRKEWIAWMTEVAAECLRVCKPGAHALVWALPRTAHWTATAWEDAGWEVRDVVDFIHGQGFPKSADVSKAIDKKAGAKREVIGSKVTGGIKRQRPDNAEGYSHSYKCGQTIVDDTAPATPDAKTWAGYGSALKPAHENWYILRKPLDGTIAQNCLKHGCGALAIDGSRVGTDTVVQHQNSGGRKYARKYDGHDTNLPVDGITTSSTGRWPANLCHDSSPEVLAEFAKAGVSKSKSFIGASQDIRGGNWLLNKRGRLEGSERLNGHDDAGTPARFFASCPAESGDYPPFWYGAKAGRKEKEKGLEGEEKSVTAMQFNDGMIGAVRSDGTVVKEGMSVANTHPTIKSLSLMRWLLGLVKMPTCNKVLDCFAGTGTTLIAANQLGMDAVGIEQSEEYVRIAELRLKAWSKKDDKKLKTENLFEDKE